MFSIGSLYIIKTWDRDASGRERTRNRDVAAITASAPEHGVGLMRTTVNSPLR